MFIVSFKELFFSLRVCRMRVYPENGLLYLLLIKSTHLVKAYKKTQEIVVSNNKGVKKNAVRNLQKFQCTLFIFLQRVPTIMVRFFIDTDFQRNMHAILHYRIITKAAFSQK